MTESKGTAPVSYEEVGRTSFGDPEILVTVLEPHPKAGFQLLMRSTASMDHLAEQRAKTGKTSYLVYPYPEPDRSTAWHGATRDTTLEGAIAQIAEYISWIWEREQIAELIDATQLRDHLDRFQNGLHEYSAVDYQAEWRSVLEEIARINLIMSGVSS